MKKYAILFVITVLCLQLAFPQLKQKKSAPLNPIGYKYKKEHFKLEGDVYAYHNAIFNEQGNLIYNYGTVYYYDNSGVLKNNSYNDSFKLDANGNVLEYKNNSGTLYQYDYDKSGLLRHEKHDKYSEKWYNYDDKKRIITTKIYKNGQPDFTKNYKYRNSGDTLVVDVEHQYIGSKTSLNYEYYYLYGYLVKEVKSTLTYTYNTEIDAKGNRTSFYSFDNPSVIHYTPIRYYSDRNSPQNLEFGYHITKYNISGKKQETVYINGKRSSDITISKGLKQNERVVYDGLTKTYYSVPNIIPTDHTLDTRIPITKVLSVGKESISYAHDGRFINYVKGSNKGKSRDFAYLGPHMIDYRVDKELGITYIVENYKNIKYKNVKPLTELSRDKASIFYTRDLEKDNFFIVIKGKHLDYNKATFEYLSNGDPVIKIDGIPRYILEGFKNAKHHEVKTGRLYKDELEIRSEGFTQTAIKNDNSANTNAVVNSTITTKSNTTKTNRNCLKGNCQNGWGREKINDVLIDATYKNGTIEGLAFVSYPNGYFYHGEYKNGFRDGFGYFKWASGTAYVGEWKKGKQHGYGHNLDKNNAIFGAGIYENGKIITNLDSEYSSGKKSTDGKCIGNCYNGFGRYTYNNGDVFIGFFKNGFRAKIGTYLWKNNSSFTGSYTSDGKQNGYGIYTYVDGSVFKGMFKENQISGLGIMKYAKSGNIVEGYFNNKGAKVKDY